MQKSILTTAFPAHADVPARTLVAIRNDGSVESASGTNSNIIGVSTDVATTAQQTCDVVVLGLVDVRAGAALGAGDVLTSDADGKALPTTTNAHRIGGVAFTSAASEDELVTILVTPGVR